MAATLFYIPKTIPLTSTGTLMSGAKANFFTTGTTDRLDTYTDETLGTPLANPVIADGNGVFVPIYLDDTNNYNIDLTDSLDVSLSGYPVDNLAGKATLVTDLASTANAKGASLIGVEDSATDFAGTTVEAVLAEIIADYAATTNSNGASKIGIEDALALITATNVEAALAEMVVKQPITKFKTSDKSLSNTPNLEVDNQLTGWSLVAGKSYEVIGYLRYLTDIGDLQFDFSFTQAPVTTGIVASAGDTASASEVNNSVNIVSNPITITTLGNAIFAGVSFVGYFKANAGTGGTTDFRWAQNASHANATIMKAGTWIWLRQLD